MKNCKNTKCLYERTSRIDGVNFCPGCGWKMVGLEKCECGYEFMDGDNFCERCGKPRPKETPLVQENVLDGIARAQGIRVKDDDIFFPEERSINNLDDEPENL